MNRHLELGQLPLVPLVQLVDIVLEGVNSGLDEMSAESRRLLINFHIVAT
jgi:hypothetical protein